MYKRGIVPVNVFISNCAERKQLVKPVNALMMHGQQSVMDPLPVQSITDLVDQE